MRVCVLLDVHVDMSSAPLCHVAGVGAVLSRLRSAATCAVTLAAGAGATKGTTSSAVPAACSRVTGWATVQLGSGSAPTMAKPPTMPGDWQATAGAILPPVLEP